MEVRKRGSVALLILSFWLAHSQLLLADLDQSLDATCRIRCPDGSTGSGCAFAVAHNYVWVLTAAHVVETSSTVHCEFWRAGHKSTALPGHVHRRSAAYDVAVVLVSVSLFQGVLPEVVPLAPPDFVVRPGETITSAGCAHGAWATGLKGHALGYEGLRLNFTPPPADGRSGSALMDAEGRYIVGVVSARTISGEIYGIASSIQAVYAAFGRPEQRHTALAALKVQQPGRLVPVHGMTNDQFAMTNRSERRDSLGHWSLGFGNSADLPTQCPGSICPGSSDQSRWYLLPYRYRQQFRTQPAPQPAPSPSPSPDGGGGGPWPTLPPESVPAPSPPPSAVSPPELRVEPQVTIDVSPLAEPLTGLAEAQKGLSDAVAAYLEAESRRKAEAEAERKLGAVAPAIGQAGSAALQGNFEGAADTLGESGSIWAMLAELAWTILAPLLGIGAVGYGFGRVIVRAIARALGPNAYSAAKSAIVDWWKDDADSPDEARAKERMAEKIADRTAKKLNGGAKTPAANSGATG